MIFANLGISTPVFVLGLMLAYLFAIIFKDTFLRAPPSGRLSPGSRVAASPLRGASQGLDGPLRATSTSCPTSTSSRRCITGQWAALFDALRHMILPAVALGTIPLAIIARITRSSLLDTMGLDYMRTARAKGLERTDSCSSGMRMRNALLPVVTVIGLQLGHAARRRRADRDRVQTRRCRQLGLRGDHRPRLRRDPGVHPGHRARVTDRSTCSSTSRTRSSTPGSGSGEAATMTARVDVVGEAVAPPPRPGCCGTPFATSSASDRRSSGCSCWIPDPDCDFADQIATDRSDGRPHRRRAGRRAARGPVRSSPWAARRPCRST